MSERNYSLDNVGGLMLIYMVYFHITSDVNLPELESLSFIHTIFSPIFMSWFFFKAGMFWREKPVREVVHSGVNRLIKPFCLFTAIGHIVWCVMSYLQGDRDWVHYVLSPFKCLLLNGEITGNAALWFLLTLFATRLIYSVLHKWGGWKIVAICLMLSFFLFLSPIEKPMYLRNTMLGLAFFGCGDMMRSKQYNALVALVCTVGFIAMLLFCYSNVSFFGNHLHVGYWWVWACGSLCGVIAFNNLFRYIPFRIPVLFHVGRDSMNYYVWHWIVLNVVLVCFYYSGASIDTIDCVVAKIVACVLTLPVLNAVTKHFRLT